MRIVSLIPSGTDIACALGLEKSLVGVSHGCDHPSAAGLPVLTRSSIDPTRTPAQIDADVSRAVHEGESLYLTDRALLCELRPDIVLTQSICDVCAVNSQTAARDVPMGANLVNLSATSVDDLWHDLWSVANATGTFPEELIDSLKGRLAKVRTAVAGRKQPRVLGLEWSDPPFLGGHWVPEMVSLAGGQHVISHAGEASRRATWDEIEAANPEIVVLIPCGYDLDQTIEQGRGLLEGPLKAVSAREVWATDATALFSRCTPATIRGIEVLAGILHPEVWEAPRESEAIQLA